MSGSDTETVAPGDGATTPDGCAVEVYSLLEPRDELAMVQAVASPGRALLELGAGAGRVTRPLLAAGYHVTAVDESQAMLDCFADAGAEQIATSIQSLNLGRHFDGVLLMSHLLNTDEDMLRHQFLLSCRRHVSPDGVVLIQAHPSEWFDEADESQGVDGDVAIRLHSISRPDTHRLSATVEYSHSGRCWSHPFTARRLDEGEVGLALAAAGLSFEGWLDEEHAWFSARPARP
jgi:SAM-dependent methyltransferase